jgi:hypothetical protein
MARVRIVKSKFTSALTELRGHLAKCQTCRIVLKSVGIGDLCREGKLLTFNVALLSTKLATMHRKAYGDANGFIYACPDRSRHGLDWAATAEPHPLVATQDRLF